MARGKGSTSTTPTLSHREAVDLFKRVDIAALARFVERVLPGSDPRYATAQSLRMHCVLHGHPDIHPSFVVDFRRGLAQCRPCQYRTRNLLQLFQDSRLGWGYGQTLRELQAATGARLVPERLEAQYEKLDQHRDAVRLVAWAVNHYLVNLLSPPPNDPTYNALARKTAEPTLHWLFEARGHKRELVAGRPYGVWPPLATLCDLAEQRILELSSAAYVAEGAGRFPPDRRKKVLDRVKALGEAAGPEWSHAVVYITGHDLTTPARVRLRRPDADNTKDGNILVLPGYTPDEPNGYFGLYRPDREGSARVEGEDVRLLVVEGENDETTIDEGLAEHQVPGWLPVATCGLANDTDTLLHAGFDTAYFLHDHPSPGRGNGEVWLRDRLINCTQVQALVFNGWDALVAGNGLIKDPDDVVRALGFAHFRAHVLDHAKVAFVTCDEWAFQRARVEAHDAEGVLERTAIAARYGECVGHPAQLAAYLDRIGAVLDIAPAVIRSQIVKGQDDEPGFLRRLVDTLTHDLYLLYKEDTAKGPRVFAYHRETQRPVNFLADDGPGIASALANVVGDVYTYFKERVGLPAWLFDEKVEKTAPVIKELQKHLYDYLRIAMQTAYQGLPTQRESEIMNLGPHHRPDGFGGTVQYLNTGTSVYKGVARTNGTIAWSRLPGPGDGARLFTVVVEPRDQEAKSVEDLEWGNRITLEDVRCAVHTLNEDILPAWRLKYGADDYSLISFLIPHLCVPHFSEDKINIQITGLSNSGKSTLMALLCGGQYPHLQLIDPIVYMTNYSPASVARQFDRSTLTPAFEEFTSDSVHELKARQVENITEILRQSMFPGGAKITRAMTGSGSSGPGDTVAYYLHMNSIATSIHLPRDVQDANRRLDIETVRERNRPDPAQEIFKHVTPERLREIRRIFNLGLYKFYGAYRQHYEAVVREMTGGQLFPFAVESRFVRNFYGPAAVCSLLGGDWRTLVTAWTRVRLPTLTLYAEASSNNVLFEIIMRTNAIRIGSAHTSVLALLAEGDKTPLLNSTSHGVYYNERDGYLVVDWIAALANGGVLFRAEPFCREPSFRLKHQLDQHAMAVPLEDYAARGVEEFLMSCGNPAAAHLISVLAIGNMVQGYRRKNLRKTNIGAKAEGAPPTPDASLGTPPGGHVAGDREALPPGMRKRHNTV